MSESAIHNSLNKLELYLIKNDYQGYDPYDTLNSWLPFNIIKKWGPILATQFQKRNPINIRPFIGIKKGYNPKAMGLFLLAYSNLYKQTKNDKYLEKAEYFYNWLSTNYSTSNSGIGWGYNFPWATPVKLVKEYTPTAVATGFVVRGLYEFYTISNQSSVKEIIESASNFIKNDLARTKTEDGICISYTPIKKDICYNASLLGAEVLATNYNINGDEESKELSKSAIEYVVNKQKENGVWAYSHDMAVGKDRMQIDFHQGYVLESIYNISNLISINNSDWQNSLQKGLDYYRNDQFTDNGRSYWRVPKNNPVDIHNQSQGIITFSKLNSIYPKGKTFAKVIADWTLDNMRNNKGYFYYQKHRYYTNKISYIRWSQAWMFLALSTLLKNKV